MIGQAPRKRRAVLRPRTRRCRSASRSIVLDDASSRATGRARTSLARLRHGRNELAFLRQAEESVFESPPSELGRAGDGSRGPCSSRHHMQRAPICDRRHEQTLVSCLKYCRETPESRRIFETRSSTGVAGWRNPRQHARHRRGDGLAHQGFPHVRDALVRPQAEASRGSASCVTVKKKQGRMDIPALPCFTSSYGRRPAVVGRPPLPGRPTPFAGTPAGGPPARPPLFVAATLRPVSEPRVPPTNAEPSGRSAGRGMVRPRSSRRRRTGYISSATGYVRHHHARGIVERCGPEFLEQGLVRVPGSAVRHLALPGDDHHVDGGNEASLWSAEDVDEQYIVDIGPRVRADGVCQRGKAGARWPAR